MISGDPQSITRLVRSLRQSNPVRQIAESLLYGMEPRADSLDILDSRLPIRNWRWKEQAVSAWCLGRLRLIGPQRLAASSLLIRVLSQRPTRYTGCIVAGGCLFNYMAIIPLAILAYRDELTNRIRALAAESLGLIGGEEAAVPLMEALAEVKNKTAAGDWSVRSSAVRALALVLPRMADQGYAQLPASTSEELCRLLWNKDPHVVLSVLRCLELVGSGTAAAAVRDVVIGDHSPIVRETAKRVYDVLILRAREERHRHTLLRPSTSPQNPNEVLLRPSVEKRAQDPRELLRIANTAGSLGWQENRAAPEQ